MGKIDVTEEILHEIRKIRKIQDVHTDMLITLLQKNHVLTSEYRKSIEKAKSLKISYMSNKIRELRIKGTFLGEKCIIRDYDTIYELLLFTTDTDQMRIDVSSINIEKDKFEQFLKSVLSDEVDDDGHISCCSCVTPCDCP